jgi:hypothetical protein
MPIPAAPMAYERADRTGPVHALASPSDDRALCGRTVVMLAGRPWPMLARLLPAEMTPCADCRRQVYED